MGGGVVLVLAGLLTATGPAVPPLTATGPAVAPLTAMGPAVPPLTPPGSDGTLSVEPSRVEVTMLYRGSKVRVHASAPSGAGVALAVLGGARSLELKLKGKVLGLIWMNVEDVTFPAVPEVYLLRTTGSLRDLGSADLLDRLGLGWEALAHRSSGGSPRDSLFGELADLKARDGLWEISEGGVTLEPEADGTATAATEFYLPAKVPPGEYRVLAYAFTAGEATLLGEGSIRVAQVGVAAFITDLARDHGLLYGVLAVLAAGAAGLITGVVFGLGDRKGHG